MASDCAPDQNRFDEGLCEPNASHPDTPQPTVPSMPLLRLHFHQFHLHLHHFFGHHKHFAQSVAGAQVPLRCIDNINLPDGLCTKRGRYFWTNCAFPLMPQFRPSSEEFQCAMRSFLQQSLQSTTPSGTVVRIVKREPYLKVPCAYLTAGHGWRAVKRHSSLGSNAQGFEQCACCALRIR